MECLPPQDCGSFTEFSAVLSLLPYVSCVFLFELIEFDMIWRFLSFSGVDPSELECVAWSEPLQRFVPALGCTLVAEPGACDTKERWRAAVAAATCHESRVNNSISFNI